MLFVSSLILTLACTNERATCCHGSVMSGWIPKNLTSRDVTIIFNTPLMKTTFLSLAAALVSAVLIFSSFKTSESSAPGGVTVTVTLNGKPVHEALVGLSTSTESREDADYLHEAETNSKGMVTFTNLEPGMYYLDAFTIVEDENFWAEADVRVSDGLVTVDMKLVSEDEFMEE